MRYLKTGSDEFVENGRSLVRVGRVLCFPSPISPGRVVRVFEVLQIIRANPTNPLPRGALLALSFPSEHVNAKEYEWYKQGLWEEGQVPYTVQDRRANLEAAARSRRN
jgi:hypothetical protein